jgi:putative ABC transport system permease protein
VASVVVVGASISGLNAYVIERVSKVLGVNHFMIARIANARSSEQWERMDRRNKRLTWLDVDWLERQCGSCEEVGAQLQQRIDMKHQGRSCSGPASRRDRQHGRDRGQDHRRGRFILQHEVDHATNVTVIGMDVRDKFFPNIEAVGKSLKIRGIDFKVVGVEARRGSMFGQSLDNQMYIPITAYQRLYGRRRQPADPRPGADARPIPDTIDEARVALRIKHKLKGNEDDDFGLVNVGDVQRDVDQFTGAIAMVVTPITLISLVVGGIVVMNIMLVSVTERTFEIGLRKALGAKTPRDPGPVPDRVRAPVRARRRDGVAGRHGPDERRLGHDADPDDDHRGLRGAVAGGVGQRGRAGRDLPGVARRQLDPVIALTKA